MTLSPEVREIVREAAQEVLRRRFTPDEIFLEVVRVVSEARTPDEVFVAWQLLGRIDGFGRQVMTAMNGAEAPAAESSGAKVSGANPDPAPDPAPETTDEAG